ncbi:MAG: peptidase family protein [Clostridia bacterium]|nr:peptidase family protein [Clostridia bacterium]
MKWRLKGKMALSLAAIMLITMLSACSSKANEAAKQIESYIQEQERQAKSFTNIDITKLDSQNSMNIIQELMSDKYKGRKTGTKENEMAVQYIADYFKTIGLENPPSIEGYRQDYYQTITKLNTTPKLGIVKRDGSKIKDFEYPRNFVFRVLSDSTSDIRLQAPLQSISNIRELQKTDLKKDQVLLLSLAAQGGASVLQIMNIAYEYNVSAIILESDVNSEKEHLSDLTVTTLSKRNWGKNFKPVITVDSVTFAELSEAVAQDDYISVECSYTIEDRYKAANVVGFVPGTDDKLKNEYIIIAGHMDHVGDNFNGTYNAGALDNASGTAAMMEIARVIAQGSVKPRKSVVFIAFNGEEYGMLGSEYYASNPVFPLKNAVMINLDMVGSSYKMPLSISSADGHISDLKLEFLSIAEILGLETKKDNLASSDHFYFGQMDVPTVALAHMDDMHGYHSPNDTMEDVDRLRIEEVIKLVLLYLDKKSY